MPSLNTAILKTVLYADIFDFPLTKKEIWNRLTPEKEIISKKEFERSINKITKLQKINTFYVLSDKDHLIKIRKKKEKWSETKLIRAQKISKFLSIIPCVLLIGVSGSVAVGNASREDDIDLFIVTSGGLLWTTRFFVTLLVHLIGVRRTPQDIQKSSYSSKICLNMFIDESNLTTPRKEQNLYTAYEIIQMKPLFQRNNTYENFLLQNKWIKEYLPNAFKGLISRSPSSQVAGWSATEAMTPGTVGRPGSINLIERLLRNFQVRYMKRRRTTETIEEGRIKFHPQDIQPWVMQQYREKLKKYGIKP